MTSATDTGPQQAPPDVTTTAAEIPGQTQPTRFSDEESARISQATVATSEPTLLPPGVEGADGALAAAQAVAATWRSNVTITAMWSINETRNAWIHVQGLGWRKIFNGRDGAFMALVALAGQARQTGRPVSLREEADGMIYEIYLW